MIAHDPGVDFAAATHGAIHVGALGTLIDTDTWSPPEDAVRRAVLALAESEAAFLDVIDAWCGRHLVVWSRGRETSVMTDATGMRTCFFTAHQGESLAGSHAALVARLANASPGDLEFTEHRDFKRNVRYLPGRITPWDGVVFLTPNTALDLEQGTVRRIWPRRALASRSVNSAVAELSRRLPGQMRWLCDTGRPIVVSLTGGIDSRMTLAACRNVTDKLSTFTYRVAGNAVHESDVRIAEAIADALRLEHQVFELDPRSGSSPHPGIDQALATNTLFSHFRAGARAFRERFPRSTIHVRSNIAEVGRAFYAQRRRLQRVRNPRQMATVWKRMGDNPDVRAAFSEWADAVEFWDVDTVGTLDLFYWEHRMPCWHGNVVLESDIAFESHSIFNARSVLEVLLSVPEAERRDSALCTEFIQRSWPALGEFPVA